MSFANWALRPEAVLSASPVMPVVQINALEEAIPLAAALFAGGINAIEVTLRTPVALDVVRVLVEHFPNQLIGVGTVLTPEQLHEAVAAGAQFAFSPGLTSELLHAGAAVDIPFIPGIASVSELMQGMACGYTHFKFFPAAAAGGIPLLRALTSPFPHARFCPTGGINAANFRDYLALPNVVCVGGSWIAPEDAIKMGNWTLITDLCNAAHLVSDKCTGA